MSEPSATPADTPAYALAVLNALAAADDNKPEAVAILRQAAAWSRSHADWLERCAVDLEAS